MLTQAQLRKGWCPGALSPMRAKDGFLVRLRITGGVIGGDTVRRLANASRAHGNALVDLSSRGNLQLRGVSDASLPTLIEALHELDLIDQEAGAESVRNVMISPLAGIGAAIDVRPIGAALEDALVGAMDLRRLPPKFCFLIDDGGPLPLDDAPADIRFAYREELGGFAISIGGSASEAAGVGVCAPDEIVARSLALARAFLAIGATMPDPPRRMTSLISAHGAATLAESAGLSASLTRKPIAVKPASPVGLTSVADTFCFGAAAPFGRLSADMLDAAADAAEVFGRGEVRLTPWRTLILPHVDGAAIDALRRHFAAARFIVSRDDPRLAIAACAGAPACERATTQTHDDALALAGIARNFGNEGVALHVSGCAKGCARPRTTPVTLVGNAGLYDLIIDGASYHQPDVRNLTLTAARDILQNICTMPQKTREANAHDPGAK